MAQYSGFKQLLGYVVSMFLIALPFYQWDMSQRKLEERIHETQGLRKQLLRETCAGDKETFKHRLEDVRDEELANLIVDDKHGIIYCYIPKVACTNWKKVMFSLTQDEPYPDPVSISRNIHLPNTLPLLISFPRLEMKAKLKHYTKFLFVRDPFVRLISAYRDKFLKRNEEFYQKIGRHILRLYANQPDPPHSVDKAIASGIRVSFQNFIQYLVERNVPFEPHWRQMQRLCLPCLIKYDFVGHQETLQQDTSQLLKILMLQDDIQFPHSYENMTTHAVLLDWFSAVPLEDRRKLYELYEEDFRMFGYKRPRELLDG
nr:carbohydrate sulfotransferase 12-like [Pseudochaenichthys georgianus]